MMPEHPRSPLDRIPWGVILALYGIVVMIGAAVIYMHN